MPISLEFDWPSMRVALEGLSCLDLPKLNVKTKAEAKNFCLAYGYDLDDLGVREEIWRLYFQSISFIRDQLLETGEKFPEEFLSRGPQTDILRLLLDASSVGGVSSSKLSPLERQRLRKGKWACSILRVMHIISHLDNDVRLENFNFAREQIFERFDSHVTYTGSRRWKFGSGPNAVTLVRYIKKERKDRNSILIKLLSKPNNVVEEIFDRLGLRFVTENRFDCYRLVQAMINLGVVSAPNIHPGRAINSLIPFDILSQNVDSIRKELEKGEISWKVASRKIQSIEQENLVPLGMMRNPFSSRWYRAIQFTSRQLIGAPDPTFKFWQEIQRGLAKVKSAETALKKIPITLREKRTFYYPFEVQIMDLESYVESIGGRSRHRDYKAKQRLMARNRVLRDLV
jgi:uncharacterized protein (TIGR04562 family)